MKRILSIMIGLWFAIVWVGCESEEEVSRREELAALLKKEVAVYFNELNSEINFKEYTPLLLNHDFLVEQDTHSEIYKGDRISYHVKTYPSSSAIRTIMGEFSDDNDLLGIKVEYNQVNGSLIDMDDIELCEAFIEKFQLAQSYSYLERVEDNEQSTYKFKVSNDDLLKIYLDKGSKRIIGFLRYDGIDL